jgi:cystathionine beta-lyase/cystathionine gamma-synthase
VRFSLSLSGLKAHRVAGHSTSTTFRQISPERLAASPGKYDHDTWDASKPSHDVYSRCVGPFLHTPSTQLTSYSFTSLTQPTLTRVESVLSSILGGPTIALPSGLSAVFQILLLVRPDVIALTTEHGYHGCKATIEVYREIRGEKDVVSRTFS